MIGAIIGDIVGSRFEWDNHRSKDFDLLTHKCFFTDDSVMSLAVCDALMKCQGDYSDLGEQAIRSMQSVGRPYPHCGYGGSFQRWMYSDTEPYAFKDVVYQRLIELCTDICKRNGKTKLLWLGDKAKTLNYTPKSDEMVLTVHRWFANKSCPGNWMYARMGDLASKVTAALGSDVKPADPVKPTPVGIKAGDLVTITGSTYYNGKSIPGWVKKLRWYVVEVSGDRAVINKDESGRYAIMSPVKTSALAVAGTKPSEDYRIHTVVHGDTLWAIAKKYLGNGSRYKEIVSLNGLKSNVIYSGMKLKIPNK